MPVDQRLEDKIDKEGLYGRFQAPEDYKVFQQLRKRDWMDELYRRLVHKSVDEPLPMEEEDMGVNVTNKRVQGIGWKELAVLGLMVMGGYYIYDNERDLPIPQPPIPAPVEAPRPPESAQPQVEPQSFEDKVFIPELSFGPESDTSQ